MKPAVVVWRPALKVYVLTLLSILRVCTDSAESELRVLQVQDALSNSVLFLDSRTLTMFMFFGSRRLLPFQTQSAGCRLQTNESKVASSKPMESRLRCCYVSALMLSDRNLLLQSGSWKMMRGARWRFLLCGAQAMSSLPGMALQQSSTRYLACGMSIVN